MSGDAHLSAETGVVAVTTTTHQQQQQDPSSSSGSRTSEPSSQQQHQHQLLPDILGQLRLVPNRPLIKLPADDYPNPFQLYATASAAAAITSTATTSAQHCTRPTTSDRCGANTTETTIRDQLFGPKCCGCSGTAAASSARRSHKSAEHSILHPKQFKQPRSTGDGVPIGAVGANSGGSHTHDRRRAVLRQPQLRLLEQCLQHGLTRSCAGTAERPESPTPAPTAIAAAAAPLPPPSSSTSAAASTTSLSPPPPPSQPARRSVQERLQRGHRNWSPRDSQLVDFRSLLTGCENLCLSVGSVLPAEHRSRAFRQLQQHPHPNHQHSHHSTMHSARQLSRLKTALKSSSHTAMMKAPRSRSEDRVYSGHSGQSATAAAAAAAAAASSCSQQALRNQTTVTTAATAAATECDVTIDELASYFETFVHIPKKMSSMAEMMYI